MKRQPAIRARSYVRFVAARLMLAGMLLHSMGALAEDSASPSAIQPGVAQTTANPDVNGAPSQPVHRSHVSKGGKAMVTGGFVLVGAGVLTIATTAALSSAGFKPSGAKGPALYAGGAGAAAIGVTLISFGLHRRSK